MNQGQKKSIFIIELLKNRGSMTRSEITAELKKAMPNEAEMSRSSWNRYLENIKKNTPYHIEYDKEHKSYVLCKDSIMVNDSMLGYLLASYDITDSASLMMKHSDVIYNADTVAGTSAINIILQAIDEHRGLTFTYTSFVNNTKKTRNFIPYFLSTWDGRWYLVAESETHPGDLYMYALDRMSDIKLSFEKVKRTVDITAEEYFRDSYGIQHSTPEDAMDIIIRVYGHEVQYVRSKKIHPSQEEINTCDEYSDFRLHLAPCYNFYQKLLWHREALEVLEPKEVREELTGIATNIINHYKRT